jgi:hypothetical protein
LHFSPKKGYKEWLLTWKLDIGGKVFKFSSILLAISYILLSFLINIRVTVLPVGRIAHIVEELDLSTVEIIPRTLFEANVC